ncbi:cytochrome b/b6 domain-containing protein [Afifella sp. H1R]|uniref:cytochrome b/b6 domain-containing protein n=1 Tax=unclassified Afifella TaxID=2624128 RepID=UPI001F21D9E7|nr:cytochrome b/b6 domain-containing protein [Afifella sp. H1R]MCF1503780.1 cytochrome b/b6 domain-containing protein [Afifella sp. H1R]
MSTMSEPGRGPVPRPSGDIPHRTGHAEHAPLQAGEEIRVWDPVVRIFHWALVVAFAAAWGLGKFGPDEMTLHFYAGYTVAALVVIRIVWGFVGSANARFVNFVKGPRRILHYARHFASREPSNCPGHNPLGALFIVGVLIVLAMQIGTGLLADPEDYINAGPLAKYVSIETARQALSWHEPLSTLLLIMVGVHIASIVFYKLYKHEDLITPMFTGRKKGL